jgi:Tfp pilus assembly protein PilF
MRPIHYIVVFTTVILGIVLSIFLIPGNSELALINFKSNNFDQARADYEKRLASGDLSASVVNPLAELYLQYGRTSDAIALFEKYVAANPSDVDAKERLAKYYAASQRPHDYLQTLEELTAKSPTEARLRELIDIYAFHGEADRELATQKRVTELFPGKPEDLVRLASLQASAQRFSEASDSLVRITELYPGQMTADTAQFMISLLLDAKRTDEAIRRAKVWLERHPTQDMVARLVATLDLRNQSAAALEIAESFSQRGKPSADLLVELVHLEVKNGKSEKALERLNLLYESKQLPQQANEAFFDLLIAKGEGKRVVEVAETSDLALLPEWLLSTLADTAIYVKKPEFADKMVATLGEGFLAKTPLLGARLALLRKDTGRAAQWLAKAEAAEGTPQERLDLASLYEDIKLPKAAFRVLDALRKRSPTAVVQSAWAVAAAQNNRGAEAAAWLGQLPASQPSVQTLTDLYFVGQDNKENKLVVAAAERLLDRNKTDENRLRYANALVQAERTADALPVARELFNTKVTDDRETLYIAALTAARNAKQPVETELAAYWNRKLAATGINSSKREEIIFALLDTGASEAVLPDLARLAAQKSEQWLSAYKDAALKANRKPELIAFLKRELQRSDKPIVEKEPAMYTLIEQGSDSDTIPFLRQFSDQLGGNWNFSYEDALTRNNRNDELREHWIARAARPDATRDDRYNIAVRMLETGNKPEAERLFMNIGKDANPSDPEVNQLLYLWGPRPPDYGLDWIEERAKTTKQSSARAQWVEYLLNAAAADRVAKLAAGDSALLDAYIRALTATSDAKTLSKILLAELPKTDQAETLRQYAHRCLEVSESETARAIFTKLATVLPQDREALRWLGALNYANGQWMDAEMYYTRYFALNVTDYESDFYFGEILLRKQDFAGANSHFEKTLQQIERSSLKPFEMRAVRAVTLDRLGKTGDSIAEYEKLLMERPKDKNLRADYAGLLIRERRLKDADRVLSLK